MLEDVLAIYLFYYYLQRVIIEMQTAFGQRFSLEGEKTHNILPYHAAGY